ncbi:MAG TPA: hypothetical protein PKA35_14060 [Paracoccus solventivorans]|uniref:hypothetical protein n=1 Tax=Paracoccus solventivorans TaxID=53463 RepID=UPI002CC850F8|nr:hypothetical protein [Paracoccus solventivorans]HMM10220.1 hypothetical protein [Paracoccus solventivorans]
MTRLLIAAMLAALIGAPAQAQTASDAPADDAAAQAAPAADAAGEDDDDDDDDAPAAAASTVQHHDFGPSGIMARSNREDLAPMTLSSGKPVAEAEYSLQSGGFYRVKIVSDGTQELALSGGDFFRAVWINEVVINDIEIRPLGVHSIEFDDAGEAEISFIAIMPGRYTLSIPGSSGESQQAVFNIR